jgi:hypothetical protein
VTPDSMASPLAPAWAGDYGLGIVYNNKSDLSEYLPGTLLVAESMARMNVLMSPEVLPGTTESGQPTVKPDSGAGEFGKWVVTYRAGSEGISTGGGVRVQLPQDWFARPRNSQIAVQAADPTRPRHVPASIASRWTAHSFRISKAGN